MKLIEKDGGFYLEHEGDTSFLCGSASGAVGEIQKDSDVIIASLENLREAVVSMSESKCPLCSARLVVEAQGRYTCLSCNTVLVNTRGFKLPSLFVDELILGARGGKQMDELTTTASFSGIPKGLSAKPVKPSFDYSMVCPKCYGTLNRKGECPKCGWKPDDKDKLWEQVIRIMKRVTSTWNITENTMELDIRGGACKIYIEDIDGLRFKARLENINRDSVREITGRPKAIINRLVDWCNISATSTNFQSTPHDREALADSTNAVRINGGTGN